MLGQYLIIGKNNVKENNVCNLIWNMVHSD